MRVTKTEPRYNIGDLTPQQAGVILALTGRCVSTKTEAAAVASDLYYALREQGAELTAHLADNPALRLVDGPLMSESRSA